MVLYYVEGYTVDETARMLGLGRNTLKSRLHRGRTLLRSTIELEEVRP